MNDITMPDDLTPEQVEAVREDIGEVRNGWFSQEEKSIAVFDHVRADELDSTVGQEVEDEE